MSTQSEKRPSHEVFQVKGDGDKSFWTRIGAALLHKDGKGFSISVEAIPIHGRIVVRPRKVATAGAGGQK